MPPSKHRLPVPTIILRNAPCVNEHLAQAKRLLWVWDWVLDCQHCSSQFWPGNIPQLQAPASSL